MGSGRISHGASDGPPSKRLKKQTTSALNLSLGIVFQVPGLDNVL